MRWASKTRRIDMSTSAVGVQNERAPGFWGSTNGKKAVMAVTGAILFIFVIGHLAGNLQVFEGPAKLNAYGKLLHDLGELLWPVRIILLICVTLHIIGDSATRALEEARAAGGLLGQEGDRLVLCLAHHVLERADRAGVCDLPPAAPDRRATSQPGAAFIEGDVYHNVVAGFQVWWVSVWYIFSIILLGLHLRHGIWSMFQSLGMNHPRHTPILKSAAWVDRAGDCAGVYLDSDQRHAGGGEIDGTRLSEFRPDRLSRRGTKTKFDLKLVNPANKRKHTVIVVGSGLAGASAAATLGELGYNVKCFCFQDSPRRAHSIAAQGGINAAKNYQNDGDSVYRLFYDTVKGGDFRSREANVYRLAEISVNIIDQCVAQGVPFAREYGGSLTNRSFGGAQVSRTFYARGQTGQQLLLGAYQALERQVHAGTVEMLAAHRDAGPDRDRRQGARHCGAQPGDGRDHDAHRGCRDPGDAAATATSTTCRPTRRDRM